MTTSPGVIRAGGADGPSMPAGGYRGRRAQPDAARGRGGEGSAPSSARPGAASQGGRVGADASSPRRPVTRAPSRAHATASGPAPDPANRSMPSASTGPRSRRSPRGRVGGRPGARRRARCGSDAPATILTASSRGSVRRSSTAARGAVLRPAGAGRGSCGRYAGLRIRRSRQAGDAWSVAPACHNRGCCPPPDLQVELASEAVGLGERLEGGGRLSVGLPNMQSPGLPTPPGRGAGGAASPAVGAPPQDRRGVGTSIPPPRPSSPREVGAPPAGAAWRRAFLTGWAPLRRPDGERRE
jgi:hypothetical protein